MTVGVSATTLSQSSNKVSGSHQIRPDQKFAPRSRTFDFCNVDWIVPRESVPPGPTVNQKFYLNVLKRFRESRRVAEWRLFLAP